MSRINIPRVLLVYECLGCRLKYVVVCCTKIVVSLDDTGTMYRYFIQEILVTDSSGIFQFILGFEVNPTQFLIKLNHFYFLLPLQETPTDFHSCLKSQTILHKTSYYLFDS